MTTYTSQPDETDGIDNWIREGNPTTNYGTTGTMLIGFISGNGIARGLIKFDLTKGTNPINSTKAVVSTDATLTLYCDEYFTTKTLAAYECLRNWVESESTWNIYSTGNNWTTVGAGSAGNDYNSTSVGSVSVSSTGAKDITIPKALIQKWVDTQNYGLVLRNTSEADNYNRFVSSAGTTASQRPKLTFEYILGGQVIIWSSE